MLKNEVKRLLPVVSVIIPVYNVERYLDECLNSACNQTLKNIEIICVNDGSTDSSLRILQKYAKQDERIIIINQNNQGLSHSRNIGIQQAKGKFIYFLDSDDYIAYEALEFLVNKMIIGNLDMLLFNVKVFGERNVEDKRLQREIDIFNRVHEYPSECKGEDLFRLLIENEEYFSPVSAQLILREFLEENSLKFQEGIIHEDELYTFKCLLLASKVGYTEKAFYFRRVRQSSIMDLNQSEKVIFSVLSGFKCITQMVWFCSSAKLKEENEKAVFSNIKRIIKSCGNRYGMLDEAGRMRVLELAGEDKLLFKVLISSSHNNNEIIKQLKTDIKNNIEIIRQLEVKQMFLQKDLIKIKESKGYKVLSKFYYMRDLIKNGFVKIVNYSFKL